jgi:hypothetical protein
LVYGTFSDSLLAAITSVFDKDLRSITPSRRFDIW